MPIRVAIVEDHVEFRESVSYLLEGTAGFKCIGIYGTAEEALRTISRPDIILLDINLPRMSGIEAIPKFREQFPGARIIMLTIFDDDRNVFDALVAGADGYILKKTAPVRLLQAIEDAAAGGSAMSPSIARQALELFRRRVAPRSDEQSLSPREQEILSLLVDGLSLEDIAAKLDISWQTVRNHVRHIYEKLHVHTRAEALVKAMKQGLA